MSRFDAVFLTFRSIAVMNAILGIQQILLTVANLLTDTPFSWEFALSVSLVHLGLTAVLFVFTDSLASFIVKRARDNDLALSLGIGAILIAAIWLPQLVQDWIQHLQQLRLGPGPSIAFSLAPAMLAISILLVLLMPLLDWSQWKRRFDPDE